MAALFTKSLLINQGATFKETWTWATGDPAVPVNLTGCTARMHVRQTVSFTTVLASLTTENACIVLGGALGTVDIKFPAVMTEKFSWLTGVYDLEIVFSDSTVVRLAEGSVNVSMGVTR